MHLSRLHKLRFSNTADCMLIESGGTVKLRSTPCSCSRVCCAVTPAHQLLPLCMLTSSLPALQMRLLRSCRQLDPIGIHGSGVTDCKQDRAQADATARCQQEVEKLRNTYDVVRHCDDCSAGAFATWSHLESNTYKKTFGARNCRYTARAHCCISAYNFPSEQPQNNNNDDGNSDGASGIDFNPDLQGNSANGADGMSNGDMTNADVSNDGASNDGFGSGAVDPCACSPSDPCHRDTFSRCGLARMNICTPVGGRACSRSYTTVTFKTAVCCSAF